MNRVLVTGATGFVGRPLVETLTRQGLAVRAALRRERVEPLPGVAECEVVGDISSRTDWTAALRGVDAVVHTAARVHVMNDGPEAEQLYLETNCHATLALAEAAVRAGVRRFVFISSIKVNGEETSDVPFRASDVVQPLDPYGRSKWLAEQGLKALQVTHGLEIVVIRPPLVYGPEVKANFLRLMQWVARGRPLPLGAVRNARSLVSVWNLCDLIAHSLASPVAAGGTWLVSDGEDLSTPELIRRIGAVMPVNARLIGVPPALLQWGGALVGRGAELRRLCGSLVVDATPTQRELEWRPPLTVDEGLSRTVDWFRSRRVVA